MRPSEMADKDVWPPRSRRVAAHAQSLSGDRRRRSGSRRSTSARAVDVARKSSLQPSFPRAGESGRRSLSLVNGAGATFGFPAGGANAVTQAGPESGVTLLRGRPLTSR